MSAITDLIDITSSPCCIVVVGGSHTDRATICQAESKKYHFEPVSCVEDLTARDFAHANLFLVWDDDGLVDQLKRAAASTGTWAPMIAVSHRPPLSRVVDIIASGVLDFLDWPDDAGRLSTAIDTALVNGAAEARVREPPIAARRRMACLTLRERQVVSAIARGLSNKAIGREFGISPRTVEIHRAKLLAKLGVRNSAEAIRLTIEAGMVDAPNPDAASAEVTRGWHYR